MSLRLRLIGLIAGALALVPSVLWTAPVHAARFKLVYEYDKRTELCRTFHKNLAEFPNLSESTHEWPLAPKLSKLKKPMWESVNIREHLDIVKTLYEWNYDSADPKFGEEAWEHASRLLPEEISNGWARLDIAHLDFDNAGSVETIYRYFHRMPDDERSVYAGEQPTEGYWYIYFDPKDNVAPKAFRLASDRTFFYDSFLYEGRFYLIRWDDPPKLTIFEPVRNRSLSDMGLLPVCSFRLVK